MTERSVTHATFTLERDYRASPARVFAAWSDPKAKQAWFLAPEEFEESEHELDFRVGGREYFSAAAPDGGPVFTFDARYQDIVENQRIVWTYEMHMDDKRISVSVATVEIRPASAGTRLVMTEQGAYLDGYDKPKDREQGTVEFLNSLGAYLEREEEQA
jgi:uncharacterized protein YndB with AHSA1/START domain